MIRIAFFITTFSDGGAQRQCAFLINELKKRDDVHLTLFYVRDDVHSHLVERAGIDVVQLPYTSFADPRISLFIARYMRHHDIRLIMTWLRGADLHGFFIRMLAPRVKWVMAERNSRYANTFKLRLRRVLGRTADAIIANSQAGKQYWEKLGAKASIQVIDNIIQPSQVERLRRQEPIILYVGRLRPQKNIDTLISAFCIVAERRPDIVFEIVGDGTLRDSAEEQISRRGLQDRIILRGFRDDVPEFMARASLLVTLSHHEGMPNVLLEAVNIGVPIVASDIPEHTDILGSDYSLLVPDGKDSAACADAIERGLQVGTQVGLLETARRRLEDMTPGSVSEKYMAAFSEIISSRR